MTSAKDHPKEILHLKFEEICSIYNITMVKKEVCSVSAYRCCLSDSIYVYSCYDFDKATLHL